MERKINSINEESFAAFILTHGRPDNVITYKTLRKAGYTGRILIVIDDEDQTADQYRENFPEEVVQFSKSEIAKTFDEADNFQDRRAIIYARNASFEIAKELGIKYFIQLDDDYTKFDFRINGQGEYPSGNFIVKSTLDDIFLMLLNYYKSIPAKSIAIAQGGDYIGGKESSFADFKLKRKAMNTFICSTERPFKFVGRINEDVNTYTWYQSLGNLFLTIPLISITQKQTQTNKGGMTELYLDSGTYIKSFYSVIFQPSSVKIGMMGTANRRLHHVVNWKNTVPMILSEDLKKK